jgi:hypothetical protein
VSDKKKEEMKKIYLSVSTILLGTMLHAQSAFWTPTEYKGAFPVSDNSDKTNWTAKWSNFDPENTVYGSTTTTVSSDITTNTTWSGIIKLENKVYVKNGATLTIAPGTIIRGDKTTQGTLIITRGSKIIAEGTIDKPIVFTSNETVGNRAEGDWGGLVLLGKAVNNQPGGVANIEGITPSLDTEFGGNDDADNSGILKYLRVEFAGIALQPNKEINGITFGSVGNKTVVDFVQVSFSGDDSYEWFGGTVDCKHLIAYRGLDDDFDTDFGYRGRVQFGLIIRDPEISDAAGDSNGLESDNDATGSNNKPLTSPVYSNLTIIGPKGNGTGTLPNGEKFEKAFRLRRNTGTSVFNSIVMGWEKGLSVEGASTEDNYTADTAVFANNILADLTKGTNVVTASQSFYSNWFGTNNNDTTSTVNSLKLVNAFPAFGTMVDARLQDGSSASSGASFKNKKFVGGFITEPTGNNAFWTETKYRGAFKANDNTDKSNWTAGWANFDPENTVYGATTKTVSSDITTNTTWSGIIKLENKVYVKNGATLTIEPGTIIRGDKTTQGSLIVTRGSKIIADGSVDKPIIFTSNESVGNRAEGDWGGLVLLGKAINNQPGGVANIEGITPSNDTEFGGTNDEDSSGVLRFVRVEFAGIALQPNKEINGVTFGSVGSKTLVDFVQVSFSGDDSFEWFGGTVDCKHLIAYRGLDDDFDTDFGYRGRIQFGLVIRDPEMSDAAGDSNGLESDNDATGSNNQPLTAAVFSNLTIVGAKADGNGTLPNGEKFEKAFRIRRNSAISVFNSVIVGWEKGLSIEGTSTEDNLTGDTSEFANNSLVKLPLGMNVITASKSFYTPLFGPKNNDTTMTVSDIDWTNAFVDLGKTPDFRLNTNSKVLENASFTSNKFRGGLAKEEENTNAISETTLGENIVIYPNPAKNNVTIKFGENTEMVNVRLLDLSGKLIQDHSTNGSNINLNIENLNTGVYLIQIISNNQSTTERLIIE